MITLQIKIMVKLSQYKCKCRILIINKLQINKILMDNKMFCYNNKILTDFKIIMECKTVLDYKILMSSLITKIFNNENYSFYKLLL